MHHHPFAGANVEFEIRGLTFTLQDGVVTLGGTPVSLRDLTLFAIGKIDLAPPPPPTIAETVIALSGDEGFDGNTEDFDLLREALAATGLDEVVGDAGADFTVFAPTDGAFIKLAQDLGANIADDDEAGALAAILEATAALAGGEAEGLELLKNILLYHVAPEGRTLAELQGDLQTAFGPGVVVDGNTVTDADPDIADPAVVIADVAASNGVIQAIDRVLLPIDLPGEAPEEPEPEPANIVDIAAGSADFTLLVRALAATDLVETVRGLGDATVFAPTNGAFANLAADLGYEGAPTDEDAVFDFLVGALTTLGGGDPIPLLADILLYHVSPTAKTAAELDALPAIPTAQGATIEADGAELIDQEPDVANPTIVIADIPAANGVVQAIDRVLLPIDIEGNEVGNGGRGDDALDGGDRDDLVFGFNGDDTISGGRGDDRLVGGRGDDDLSGDRGDDAIFGRKGDDALSGGLGEDKLVGGRGDDRLDGGEDDDRLIGGFGDDTLDGGAGNDVLNGGRGADVFLFTALAGVDTVVRLDHADTLVFSTEDFADFDALLAATSHVRGGARIETVDGDAVFLRGEFINRHDEDLFAFV